jgi:hypothetical protein
MSLDLKYVHLFHILIVGSLFVYIGIQKTSIDKWIYPILFVLGIVLIFYHTYKAYKYYSRGINPWFNIIHILLIGPLLVYIGYNKEKTSLYWFDLLMMLGFASIGYHGYYLYKEMNK